MKKWTKRISIHKKTVEFFPQELWEGDNIITKTIFIGPWKYVEQNYYLKIWIRWLWGRCHLGKGARCPPISFVTLKGH